jgi:hypothetical protein
MSVYTISSSLPYNIKLRVTGAGNAPDPDPPIIIQGYRSRNYNPVPPSGAAPIVYGSGGTSVSASTNTDPDLFPRWVQTHNVDKGYCDAWLAQNQGLDMVKNGHIVIGHRAGPIS